jgi:hypothetical protein
LGSGVPPRKARVYSWEGDDLSSIWRDLGELIKREKNGYWAHFKATRKPTCQRKRKVHQMDDVPAGHSMVSYCGRKVKKLV